MKKVKRSLFTLLEMLVVLCILALGLSLTGIKIKQAYEEQQLLAEVQEIVSHLQMAQDLMLIMDTNTEVYFGRDPEAKEIYYQLKIQGPWNSHLFTNEGKHRLKAIRRLEFNDEAAGGRHELVIKFYSKGFAMTSGKLVLSGQEQKDSSKDYQICLPGYPRFIESQKYQPMARPAYVEQQPELFPNELLELLDANKKNEEKARS